MHTTKIFSVMVEDREIFKGSAVEIQKHLNLCGKDIVYAYARYGHKLYGRYRFIPAGERKSEGNRKTLKKIEKAKPKPTKHQQKLEYLAWHLKHKEGITTLKGNPKDFVDELKEMGLPVRYYHAPLGGKKDFILEIK